MNTEYETKMSTERKIITACWIAIGVALLCLILRIHDLACYFTGISIGLIISIMLTSPLINNKSWKEEFK